MVGRKAQDEPAPRTETQGTRPRVMAVTSGKGGVGKTNLVAGLARAYADMGLKVLIFDADLGLANVDILFGMRPAWNIGHVLKGEKRLAEVVVQPEEGIRIIPGGTGTSELTSLTEGQKLALLSEFDSWEEAADIVLVDTGAGISGNVTYFNLAADECVVIATPEPTSITDAYAMMKVMAQEHGHRHFRLVVNMARSVKEAKRVFFTLSQASERFLDSVVIEYAGHIPHDELLPKAVLAKTSVVKRYPGAEASKRIRALAKVLVQAPPRSDGVGNIKFFMQRLVGHMQRDTEV